MTSTYLDPESLQQLLRLLMPANNLVCRLSLVTGLRIGDVLQLKTSQIQKQRFTIHEEKTGKSRRIYIPKKLWVILKKNAGSYWVFPGRDPKKHRTRQAVWADVKRARRALRLHAVVTPHSMRKIAAVEKFKKTGDLQKVQEYLNHDNSAVTMIYAMADILAMQKKKKKKKPP